MVVGQGLFGTSSHLLRTSTDRWHGADIERHLVDLMGDVGLVAAGLGKDCKV